MPRQIAIAIGLLFAASLVHAGEAGRVLFVAGDVRVGGNAVTRGQAIGEGDDIATGADGYMHLKTIDNGVLILRPNSRARVAAYHVDAQAPQNTRIKLELQDGTARSISGDAVKQARQNFRFNTPVAAIGVRGTDFTVFTDQSTTRVSVASGGVVVSGFDGPCTPQGGGPCGGSSSRELFAEQSGQLLQVTREHPVPQLLREPGATNNLTPLPGASTIGRQGSTTASAGSTTTTPRVEDTPNPQIEAKLLSGASLTPPVPAPTPTPEPTPTPTPEPTPTPTPEPTPTPTPIPVPVVYQQIVWGRWQAIAGVGAPVDIATISGPGGRILSINSHYVIGRTSGTEWPVPAQGVMDFAFKQGDALIVSSSGATSPATIENGRLQINFAKAAFTTGFDLVGAGGERFGLKAIGDVASSGELLGASPLSGTSNINVSGAVGNGSAAYIFQGRLDEQRQAVGGISWIKK